MVKKTIDEELLDIVRAQLPEKEVGAIREIIERNTKLVSENKELEDRNDKLSEFIQDRDKEIADLKKVNARLAQALPAIEARDLQVSNREEACRSREDHVTKREQELDIALAQREMMVYKETIAMLLGNTVVKKSYQRQIPVGQFDSYNKCQTGEYLQTANEVETITEE